MSEGKQYIPDQFAGREFKSASVTQAKASTKLYKTSSSDPAATDDTGLGYAVGTIWTNTTSGQVFICTSDSAEDATWRGQEGDDVNVTYHQASNYGYSAGIATPSPGGFGDVVQRYALASSGNATDVGEVHTNKTQMQLTHDFPYTHGYNASAQTSWPTYVGEITRFPFSASVGAMDAADIGEMTEAKAQLGIGTDAINGKGYTVGGGNGPGTSDSDKIQTFTFASPSSATDEGEMPTGVMQGTVHDDASYGWHASGHKNPPEGTQDNIWRITKATWNGVTDVGEVNTTTSGGGQRRTNSGVAGYQHGGQSPVIDTIQKFTFASPSTSTDVGNLTAPNYTSGGASAPDYGYAHGGQDPAGPTTLDVIQRYAFDSDGNSADVGDLDTATRDVGGVQN